MSKGYVKLHRKILDSGMIQMPNTFALFSYLLLKATHQPLKVGTHTGVVQLERGQYISGRKKLAIDLKQSEREVRTSLRRLHDLDMITSKTTNRYSIYTIENYNKYQDSDQQGDQQATSKRPADDQQATTKQEHKHINTKEKNITPRALLEAENIPTKLINEWLAVRKSKRAVLTESVLEVTKREAEKAGLTLVQAIQICCEKPWAGFKAEYLKNSQSNRSGFTNQRDEGRQVAAKSIFKTSQQTNQVNEREVRDAKAITN